MNISMKQKQTHRHREQTCGGQRGRVYEADYMGEKTEKKQPVEQEQMKGYHFQEEGLHCVKCYCKYSIKNRDIIAGSGRLHKGIFRGW